MNPSATPPVYVSRKTGKKHDSFISFSSFLTLPDVGGALADVEGLHSPTSAAAASMSKESLPRSPVDSENVPSSMLPEATFDTSAPRRYTPDVPHVV